MRWPPNTTLSFRAKRGIAVVPKEGRPLYRENGDSSTPGVLRTPSARNDKAVLMSSRGVIGLALGPNRLVAHVSGSPTAWERPVQSLTTTEGRDDLAAALTDLRRELGLSRATASLALLPGLVQLKRIELPKMRDNELRAVLTRDAGRFFLAVRTPQVIAFDRLPQGRAPMTPLMVACTPETMIDAVDSAALDSGWSLERVVPAYAAWTTAALRRWPQLRHEAGQVIVRFGITTETLEIARGRLNMVRRMATTAGPPTDAKAFVLEEPALVAAMNLRDTRVLELLPERVYARRVRRTRAAARAFLGAAAACFVASAGLELWGTHRELDQIEARRAAIRARVNGIMRVRDALEGVDRRTATLTTLDRTAPQWSGTMATVASHLPLDAHLAAFRGRADSLVLEGTAERAATVFEAIQRAPGVSGVRANAPIRQEMDAEQHPVEHFAMALRLAQAPSASGEKQ